VEISNENDEEECRKIIRKWIASNALVDMAYINEVPGESPSLTIAAKGTLAALHEPTGGVGDVLILMWPSGKFQIRLLGTESYHVGQSGELYSVRIGISIFEHLVFKEAIEVIDEPQ
jgi:hypothetical protein